MTTAHVTPERTVTLEAAREAWRTGESAEHQRRHAWLREDAARVFDLYLRWQIAHGISSRRQFMVWLTGEDDPARKLYDRLSAGYALAQGLDFNLGISDLAVLGRALDHRTPPELRAMLEVDGLDAVRALVTTTRQEGTVRLPVAELPAVRAVIRSVSESDNLPDDAALALTVQAFGALPETGRAAALHAARTGEVFEDAARVVVAQMLDPRAWLSRRPCFVPGCGMPCEELHHLKLTGTRFRSQELLAPLCRRHHQAQPGLTSEAAHAAHQHDWIARHWPSQEAFWMDVAALYGERLFGDAPLNTPASGSDAGGMK